MRQDFENAVARVADHVQTLRDQARPGSQASELPVFWHHTESDLWSPRNPAAQEVWAIAADSIAASASWASVVEHHERIISAVVGQGVTRGQPDRRLWQETLVDHPDYKRIRVWPPRRKC